MATKIFGAIATTGGADGALDSILQATLSDGDLAIVGDSSENAYWYRYESSSTAAEDAPEFVRPNDYSSSGVWILLDVEAQDLKVYGNAVIDGTVLATGLITATAGINIVGTLQFDGAGPAIDVILDEDDLSSDSATALVTQQSIKAYIDSVAGALVTNVDRLAGWLVRPKFTWVDATTLTIGTGRVHLLGTAQGEDVYKWDSALTFVCESGGSNAASSDFGTSEWHYIYIDDSALAGGSDTDLTEAQFLNSTTAPIWDASECGWYNGADRCVGAFYVNSSGNLDAFGHVGRKIFWHQAVDLVHSFSSSFKDQTMRLPALATDQACEVSVYGPGNNYGHFYWRFKDDATDSLEHWFGFTYNSGSGDNRRDNLGNTFEVIANSSQVVEFLGGHLSSAGTGAVLRQSGYELPEGM